MEITLNLRQQRKRYIRTKTETATANHFKRKQNRNEENVANVSFFTFGFVSVDSVCELLMISIITVSSSFEVRN